MVCESQTVLQAYHLIHYFLSLGTVLCDCSRAVNHSGFCEATLNWRYSFVAREQRARASITLSKDKNETALLRLVIWRVGNHTRAVSSYQAMLSSFINYESRCVYILNVHTRPADAHLDGLSQSLYPSAGRQPPHLRSAQRWDCPTRWCAVGFETTWPLLSVTAAPLYRTGRSYKLLSCSSPLRSPYHGYTDHTAHSSYARACPAPPSHRSRVVVTVTSAHRPITVAYILNTSVHPSNPTHRT